jgi:antitoxin HigA-1
MQEGTLMVLQVYHDIAVVKSKAQQIKPDLNKIRRVVFRDTNIDKIDWEKHKKAVINRVFEKGNQPEKDEIIRFYGKNTVEAILNNNGQTVL